MSVDLILGPPNPNDSQVFAGKLPVPSSDDVQSVLTTIDQALAFIEHKIDELRPDPKHYNENPQNFHVTHSNRDELLHKQTYLKNLRTNLFLDIASFDEIKENSEASLNSLLSGNKVASSAAERPESNNS